MKLIFILGPPAVGKMTIGQALVKQTSFKLFHNHQSIELALELFGHGSPEFRKINEGIRDLVFKTCAASENIDGLIFTLVMAFDLQEDWDYLEKIKAVFQPYGWSFYFVELAAPMDIRLARNTTENRLKHKPSKRKLAQSKKGIIEMEKRYRLNTLPDEFKAANYIKIETAGKSVEEITALIIAQFKFEKPS